jgi:Flp pilus assembly protein TadD
MARKTTPKRRSKPPQPEVPALLKEALGYHQAGQLEAAEPLYLRILASDAGNATSLANLGMLHHQRGHFDAAADWYQRALAVRRTPEALSNLAMLERAKGQLPYAVTLLRAC